jgi:hypothetical protein
MKTHDNVRQLMAESQLFDNYYSVYGQLLTITVNRFSSTNFIFRNINYVHFLMFNICIFLSIRDIFDCLDSRKHLLKYSEKNSVQEVIKLWGRFYQDMRINCHYLK